MITLEDKKTIRDISQRYAAKRVLLFGSSVSSDGNDIDLAVEGVAPDEFYNYYGDLIFSLSKPVDIVDLSGTSKFIKLIQEEGVLLYG
jgi:predicted nucleotidyltransferase